MIGTAELDISGYLNECVAAGIQYITFTPSGINMAAASNFGKALAEVSGQENIKGLDLSEVGSAQYADLTGAFAGYSTLEVLDISNWNAYNPTFIQSGLTSGDKKFYYNELTNQSYIDYLVSLGWTPIMKG